MKNKLQGNAIALLPLLIFIALYAGMAIISKDFYSISVIVPFLISAIVAIGMNRKESLNKKIEIFCKGAGNSEIILMCVIFILAGAFAEVAKDMGAVESTVNLGLNILPSNILIAGVFIISCFIALSIGTSVGTIVALSPMAVGIAEKINIPVALVIGAVVGGAMFGDNLSMISDTTIAATRTQGCELKDKFKANFFIVLPAAIITTIIFALVTLGTHGVLKETYDYNIIKVLPYLLVLISALLGVNVLLILVAGLFLSSMIGLVYGAFDVVGLCKSISNGISGMSELIIVSLIIAGIVEIIKFNGGIEFLLNFIKGKIKSRKGAEFSIALLVTLVDICTANNTIAIVTAGPLAKDISKEYNIEPQKSASLLDTFSCFSQGVIPYGAQLLAASTLANISPFAIMKYLYYPYLMVIFALLSIILGLPRFKTVDKASTVKSY
ncbi:Na+/H+ antiporter NhaC family protein [Clostridium cochlearium]|uniref:Methionine transporter, NhaC family n=1 Tax=Clostridium cochlearium TaxID=1494 RepID=A0ABY0QPB0_CLOCO|nr:Na+/H+ antiporter NhaC family protein [Clostridium cochlearium]MBV1820538.1 Na+/H+ antiporter NhaC family protein [Bacteroidales bacterium MSK.15.36]MCG4570940.1 Na+/H+ antiporter NhaC family protein [Clostridium cochlearium]MCG4579662.1 Na+/H+ antiporter NhaC family protein [Clostridium cochlearium]SDL42424.1 putative methionine transporter, NhaC family [Clostridium cochlearium]SNV88589.1 Na+/H+ antiporter [Clostridium cochlearium]